MRLASRLVVLTAVFLAAQTGVSWAQGVPATFQAATYRLQTGQRIVIVGQDGHRTTGILDGLTPSVVYFIEDGVRREFSEVDVREIDIQRRPIGRWAIAVGAGIGYAIGYSYGSCRNRQGCADNYGPLTGLMGAGIGAGVGLGLHCILTTTPAFRAPASNVTSTLWPPLSTFSEGSLSIGLRF